MDWQQTTSNPTDEAIEAIIQQATSVVPYSRSNPLRDTRTQLFVGNLPYRVRWQDLKDLFRKAGTVLRADVSLGPDNRSRGYGTVLLATAEDAGRAVDTFNGYSWQSRILEVRLDRQLQDFDPTVATGGSNYLPPLPSTPKSPSIKDDPDYPPPPSNDLNSCRSLFVGNLPFHCQWQDLKDLFRQAGTIIRADVVLGPDGRSRGFGTVIFATDLDASRALRMFDGYEFNGRVLNVHHDKYSYSSQPATTSTSPVGGSSSSTSHPHPTHITLPPGYMLDLVSGPTSPYDMSKYQQHQHLHDQQHQQQRQIQLHQLHLQLQQQEQQEQRFLQQQYQLRQQQLQQQSQRQQQQHRSRPYDTPSSLDDAENPSDTLLKPATSTTTSTQYSNLPSSSSSSSSRPSSTPAPATTKRPIPIYKPPPLSHTNTATSSGSDKSGSDMFSRLSSTSVTSIASSASESSVALSRPGQGQGQAYSYGQVGRARGQPLQTSSPHSVSSPKPSHSTSAPVSAAASHPHLYTHHRSFPSPSPRAPSFQPSSHSTSTRPSSSNPNHHSQRPGPISLPPPLLPSQVAFSIPLQPLSPHGHTPLGMSVSVSVSPMVEYPGGFGYIGGQYQQHQQFGQHTIPLQATTPHGLPPITPSMPSFTFLPSALAPGVHVTPPTSTSPKVGAGGRGSAGHRGTRSRSKSLARRLTRENELGNIGDDEDENGRNNSNNANANASVSSGRSSSSPSPPPPPPSSARQRHHHHHHQAHHQNQQQYISMLSTQDQQSYPSRRSAGGGGSNGQPLPNISNASNQPQPQSIPLHINLASVPGNFSPGVAMSPGTFYGRPGEAPTFINATVGAPLTMRVDGGSGGGGVASEGGGVAAQMQGQTQGQWYHQNQTHGAYFYAMSSPTRRTPTGMEPKGYFDPLFFPAGVSVGGYNPSVVNEIMKDGHAHSLGVEVAGSGPGGKEEGTGREGEKETHISNGNDGEEESGDGDVGDGGDNSDGGDDSDGGDEEEENQPVQSPYSEGEDGDKRVTPGALFGSSGETIISRTQSLPTPDVPHHDHQHPRRSTEKGAVGVVEVQSDSALENAHRSAQIPKKAGSSSLGGRGQDDSKNDEFGTLDIPPPPAKTTPAMSTSMTTGLKENGKSSLV